MHDHDGLSDIEAAELRRQYGANTIRTRVARSLVRQFVTRLTNPLITVLLIASLVSAATGEVTNFVIISAIVLLSVSIDFFQEIRATSAAEKLSASVAVTATVIRDGQPVKRPVEDLVPGDCVSLSAGDLVPADGVILEARDFFVNQSMLTGEAFPVEKHAGPLSTSSNELHDATDTVFMGTSVIGGSALIRVTQTGMHSALGGISESLQTPAHLTALERET
ncbi:MAG: Mg2+-importing ATPase, partial [Pseudomonadota bacterium]